MSDTIQDLHTAIKNNANFIEVENIRGTKYPRFDYCTSNYHVIRTQYQSNQFATRVSTGQVFFHDTVAEVIDELNKLDKSPAMDQQP